MPGWRTTRPRSERITSLGPRTTTLSTDNSDFQPTDSGYVPWCLVKNRAISVRFPGWLDRCWMTGGTHIRTINATDPRARIGPTTQCRWSNHARRLDDARLPIPRPARSTTEVTNQTRKASPPTTATTGRAETSVWTTKDPVPTAANSDSPERSNDAAQRRTVKRSGNVTTIGFHGLTSPPRTDSEYVVATCPEAANRAIRPQIQTDAHRALAGVLRRRTTATQAMAHSPLISVDPMNIDLAPLPSTRYTTDSR